MKRLLVIAVSLALSGCLSKTLGINLGSDSVRMTPEHAQTVKTAGVVSLVESQPRVQFISSSLQESNLEPMVLEDWDATRTLTGLMGARLRQKGFEVVAVDAEIPIAEAYSSSASYAEPERIRERLLAVGRAHDVDMLVVIYRQSVRDFITKSSQKVISYGLYKRHSEEIPYAFSVVHIEALNVKKGFPMGNADATVELELENSAWQQNFETDKGPLRLSPVRADAVREKIIEAVTTSTMIAAQEAGLSN